MSIHTGVMQTTSFSFVKISLLLQDRLTKDDSDPNPGPQTLNSVPPQHAVANFLGVLKAVFLQFHMLEQGSWDFHMGVTQFSGIYRDSSSFHFFSIIPIYTPYSSLHVLFHYPYVYIYIYMDIHPRW